MHIEQQFLYLNTLKFSFPTDSFISYTLDKVSLH